MHSAGLAPRGNRPAARRPQNSAFPCGPKSSSRPISAPPPSPTWRSRPQGPPRPHGRLPPRPAALSVVRPIYVPGAHPLGDPSSPEAPPTHEDPAHFRPPPAPTFCCSALRPRPGPAPTPRPSFPGSLRASPPGPGRVLHSPARPPSRLGPARRGRSWARWGSGRGRARARQVRLPRQDGRRAPPPSRRGPAAARRPRPAVLGPGGCGRRPRGRALDGDCQRRKCCGDRGVARRGARSPPGRAAARAPGSRRACPGPR